MPYFCHNCHHQIIDRNVPLLECPECHSGFIEEVTPEELAIRTSTVASSQSNNVRPPIPPVRQQLVQNPLEPLTHRTRVHSEVYDPFRNFRTEAAQWDEMNNQQREGETSSADSTQRRTLEDIFRPPLDIIFRGSFTAARDYGVEKNRWLLVNIQNMTEFMCSTLNRDVWSHQTIKDILKEHFVFWQVYYDMPEGRRYVQNYKVTSYPYVAIVDPRTGEQMRAWPTSIDHNSFCDSVIEFLADNQAPESQTADQTTKSSDTMSMKKLCVSPTLYDQSEEDQLEAAIKASLQEGVDLQDEETLLDDDTLQDDDVNDDGEAEDENDDKEEALIEENTNDKSDANGKSEKVEPEKEDCEDYNNYLGQSEQFSNLIIRFPDGSREMFKFPSDSKMKALFLLLTSKGYDFQTYHYLTNFPRRYLNDSAPMDSLADSKLSKETIYVEKKIRD